MTSPAQQLQTTPQRRSDFFLQGRLHPATLLFDLLRVARGYLLPAIVLLALGHDLFVAVLMLLILVPTATLALLRYLSFTYRIEQGELIIHSGLLQRTERHIPLERVQDLRIEQNFLHRLFRVAAAVVETAGGQGAEATLAVVSEDDLQRLHAAIFTEDAARSCTTPSETPPAMTYTVPLGDLLLVGLSARRLLWSLALAGGGLGVLRFDTFMPTPSADGVLHLLYRATNRLQSLCDDQALIGLLVFAALVLAIGGIAAAISIGWSLLIFAGFTLSRTANDLHRCYGVLTRRSSSVPWHRIQVLETEEDILLRAMGLATLRADTAGSLADGAQLSGRDVLLPAVPREHLAELIPQIVPEAATPRAWQCVSPLAVRRLTIRYGLKISAAAALLTWGFGWPGCWLLLLLPAAYVIARCQYRSLGYCWQSDCFHARRGWLKRSTLVVPVRNIQTVHLERTVFDRRLGLATLSLNTAGRAYTGGGPRIPHLPVDVAAGLASRLAAESARREYWW